MMSTEATLSTQVKLKVKLKLKLKVEVKLKPKVVECDICVLPYQGNRVKVTCPDCQYHSCRQCLVTYLRSEQESKCPNCSHAWNREFIYDNFTFSFLKELDEKLKEILFQRERAQFPLHQITIQNQNTVHQKLLEIEELRARLKIATRTYNFDRKLHTDLPQTIMQMNAQVNQLLREMEDMHFAFVTKHKPTFICPCPYPDCRGFLDEATWQCGLCLKETCSKCRCPVLEGHVCNQQELETVKLLNAETRPCPKCGARVYRVSGCNQMWCTACKDCAFDWGTGKIDSGAIHNPHYYEDMRKLGREAPHPHDPWRREELGGLILLMDQVFKYQNPRDPKIKALILEIHRICNHIEYVMMPHHGVAYNPEKDSILYLRNKLDLTEFKKRLLTSYKKSQKGIEYNLILTNVATKLKEEIEHLKFIYRVAIEEGQKINETAETSQALLSKVQGLLNVANRDLKKVAKTYQTTQAVTLELLNVF